MKNCFGVQQAKIAQALIQPKFVRFYCQSQDTKNLEKEQEKLQKTSKKQSIMK